MEQPAPQVELEESANAILDRCRGARPVNTTRAYAPQQRESKVCCDRKGFHEITRYQVTASKMHLFLQEEVVDRKIRVKGSDRKVGVSTVEINQQSRGANAHPHPRNSLVKALLSSLKRDKHVKNKREYADRGVGSLLDGYCTTNQLVSISRYYMNLNTGSDLRNRMIHFHTKLWFFAPFNSTAFDIFAAQLKDKIATEQTPQATNLCALVPDLINHLKQQKQQTLSHIVRKIGVGGTSVLSIKETIAQLTSGNATVRLSVDLGG
ncbi:hypothetical protein PHPALM_27815 [Phytophthora palmivora]|uniref:Uncharacterized protein n=1 Tax=Phytophthora palmivora TaxID=4796 RepID=A0A2P4XBR1_9STRA|nr:hypothetical protein PHPALM_27815 [Phytophthora palmivora]